MEHLPAEYQVASENFTPQVSEHMTLKEAVELAEKQVLEMAAKKYDTTYDIAKKLDTSQPTIVRRLKKYGIQIED